MVKGESWYTCLKWSSSERYQLGAQCTAAQLAIAPTKGRETLISLCCKTSHLLLITWPSICAHWSHMTCCLVCLLVSQITPNFLGAMKHVGWDHISCIFSISQLFFANIVVGFPRNDVHVFAGGMLAGCWRSKWFQLQAFALPTSLFLRGVTHTMYKFLANIINKLMCHSDGRLANPVNVWKFVKLTVLEVSCTIYTPIASRFFSFHLSVFLFAKAWNFVVLCLLKPSWFTWTAAWTSGTTLSTMIWVNLSRCMWVFHERRWYFRFLCQDWMKLVVCMPWMGTVPRYIAHWLGKGFPVLQTYCTKCSFLGVQKVKKLW